VEQQKKKQDPDTKMALLGKRRKKGKNKALQQKLDTEGIAYQKKGSLQSLMDLLVDLKQLAIQTD